jgi:RND family efflux transporter MFP subunit
MLRLILCLLILASCSPKKAADESSASALLPDEVTEVSVMRLDFSDFHHELIANGTVSARNRADLRFQSTDIIDSIFVKNGDRVVKGQAIAQLDRFKLQNTLLQSRDNLERARLDLQDVLIGQGFSLADSARIPSEVMQIARVKSNFDQAANQYALAEYNWRQSVLYAPFDGVVANLFSKAHNPADASQAFCTIIDQRRPEIEFKVLESELFLLRTGEPVQVAPFSAAADSCSGQVTEINPVVDANGMVRVKAVVNQPQSRLYDGMNVRVCIQRSLGRQLVIPKEALVLRTNKKVVFTLKNDRAQWVYVETGLENSGGHVVTSGLVAGDSVIYEGNINLAHESPVKIKM